MCPGSPASVSRVVDVGRGDEKGAGDGALGSFSAACATAMTPEAVGDEHSRARASSPPP